MSPLKTWTHTRAIFQGVTNRLTLKSGHSSALGTQIKAKLTAFNPYFQDPVKNIDLAAFTYILKLKVFLFFQQKSLYLHTNIRLGQRLQKSSVSSCFCSLNSCSSLLMNRKVIKISIISSIRRHYVLAKEKHTCFIILLLHLHSQIFLHYTFGKLLQEIR